MTSTDVSDEIKTTLKRADLIHDERTIQVAVAKMAADITRELATATSPSLWVWISAVAVS